MRINNGKKTYIERRLIINFCKWVSKNARKNTLEIDIDWYPVSEGLPKSGYSLMAGYSNRKGNYKTCGIFIED
jgi:hypothetical protein